ncbi:MAG: hypothetical protein ACFFCF_07755 [Promethearchaeota archaeon]
MSETVIPMWLRILNIIVGFITIGVAFAVIWFDWLQVLTILVLITFLGVILIFLGVGNLVGGLLSKQTPTWLRVLTVILGILMLSLASLVIAFPAFGELLLIWLLVIGLLVNGLNTIVFGAMITELPGWYRGWLVIIGFIGIILSFVVIALPGFGYLLLIIYVALGFMMFGFNALVKGITGHH